MLLITESMVIFCSDVKRNCLRLKKFLYIIMIVECLWLQCVDQNNIYIKRVNSASDIPARPDSSNVRKVKSCKTI